MITWLIVTADTHRNTDAHQQDCTDELLLYILLHSLVGTRVNLLRFLKIGCRISTDHILYSLSSNGVDLLKSALNPPKTSTQTLSQTKVLDMLVLLQRVAHNNGCCPAPSTLYSACSADTLDLTDNQSNWLDQQRVWPTGYTKWLTALHPQAHNLYPLVHPRQFTVSHPQAHHFLSPPWAIQWDSVVQQILPLLSTPVACTPTASQPRRLRQALPLHHSIDLNAK